MDFQELTNVISNTHNTLLAQTSRSVNIIYTLRNWLIGYRISIYEQSGKDRAEYGEQLIGQLSQELQAKRVTGCSVSRLWSYRQFYQRYPEILLTLSGEFKTLLDQSVIEKNILPTVSGEFSRDRASQKESLSEIPRFPIASLLKSLSFSHFVELIKIDEVLKRSFYEIESVRGQWSARELRRQIDSLYYERSGLSKDKEKLSKLAHLDAHQLVPKDFIRDPYMFEFLGIKSHEALRENTLRDALLDKIQDFLLEMGKGFCFEARNKRILIGDKFYFVDLVCYHRILKAHCLIELKLEAFNHENIGQLYSYLNYYQKHEMTPGDNPPIGLLLCTERDQALVEYATTGLSNQLFVSKYQLELPNKEEIKLFLEGILRQAEIDLNK
jgi:predicted nuclease of restriction endonuclease-like (RecB) superfamily